MLIVATYLSSSEFKYIQPVAVEEVTRKTVVKEVENIVTEEIVPEKVLDTSGFSQTLELKDDDSTTVTILKIYFARNRYDISPQYTDEIEAFVAYLEENESYLVVIYGHTDNRGSELANKELSYNRAKSVQKALEEYGIQSIRLTAVGKGELSPIADNTSETGRAKNRRIEIDILE